MTDDTAFLRIQKAFNLLTVIPEEQINAFRALLSKVSYKKHDYFVQAGDTHCHAGFVLDGAFRLFYIDHTGREYTKNFMISNQFTASLNSFLRGKPSNRYIQALKDSEVLRFDYNEWMKLVDSHICWFPIYRKIIEEAYLEKEKRESDLLFYDAETRYSNFKNEFPDLVEQVKQHHIASFLGISPETLSRIKKPKN
jgi:CRP-like cAMP-binding protein